MNLLVNRTTRTQNSTIGDFAVNGNFFCHCPEPFDRGLIEGMTAARIAAIKVQDLTCIPPGTYTVTSYYSHKNGRNTIRWDNASVHMKRRFQKCTEVWVCQVVQNQTVGWANVQNINDPAKINWSNT